MLKCGEIGSVKTLPKPVIVVDSEIGGGGENTICVIGGGCVAGRVREPPKKSSRSGKS